MVDLGWVRSAVHRELLQEILDRARCDADIAGILLKGSVARGDAYPGSDLDVQVLLRDGCSRPFQAEFRRGILVERSYADDALAQSRLKKDPAWVYAYLDGRILYDPEGRLARLVQAAQTRFERYHAPAATRDEISYWLQSARIKMVAALDAGDTFRAAYVAATTSWKILEGIWAANEKPVPPCGAVWAHVGDLNRGPSDVTDRLRLLFGGDTRERAGAALDLIAWTVRELGTSGLDERASRTAQAYSNSTDLD
jgi:predicted nucleotidyltransferase